MEPIKFSQRGAKALKGLRVDDQKKEQARLVLEWLRRPIKPGVNAVKGDEGPRVNIRYLCNLLPLLERDIQVALHALIDQGLVVMHKGKSFADKTKWYSLV